MIYIRKRLKKAIECRVDEIADQENISFSKAQIWLAKYLESKTVSNHIFDHIDTILVDLKSVSERYKNHCR